MNACPTCSQAVSPNDVVCPKCGISLHPGTSTAGPASGGGKGMSVVMIVVIAVIGIVLVVGCLGLLGAGLFLGFRAGSPMPVGPPIAPVTETAEQWDSAEPVPMQTDPIGPSADQAPVEKTAPDESSETP